MYNENLPKLRFSSQFCPIKGTVTKQQTVADGQVQLVNREETTVFLFVQKERAENLVIVDLTRHDLNGVVSSGDVNVNALMMMMIEEYESVYRLVSSIEAKLFRSAISHHYCLIALFHDHRYRIYRSQQRLASMSSLLLCLREA